MKLYLLTQRKFRGYDTYDSCVVAAESAEIAQQMHPSESYTWKDNKWRNREGVVTHSDVWPNPKYVEVELIGDAAGHINAGVICASFNAG